MNKGRWATREEVLEALQQYQPHGRYDLRDLIVFTAQPFRCATAVGRVATFDRSSGKLLYDGGPKGTNYQYIEWMRGKSNAGNGFDFGEDFDQYGLTLKDMMKQELRPLQDLLERLNWLGLKDLALELERFINHYREAINHV